MNSSSGGSYGRVTEEWLGRAHGGVLFGAGVICNGRTQAHSNGLHEHDDRFIGAQVKR